MRILLINHNLEGRGTWHRAWRIGRELAQRGHGVTLWTAAPHHFYRPVQEEREGVRVLQTPSWAPLADADDGWGPLDVAYRSMRILFDSFDLCYAFAHPPNVAWPAWLASRIRRKPLLYDWCDWYEGGIFPKRQAARAAGLASPAEKPLQAWAERREVALERAMARWAGRVTVISEKIRELALAAGRREGDILLLPNGANLDEVRPLDPVACRAGLGLAPEGPYLGYVANYHPDQELLLRALAAARRTLPNLKLIATGPPFAEKLLRELGLGEAVVALGRVPFEKLTAVIGAADAMALPLEDNPSNQARVPFKFTDALAGGRPVVTCRVGDLARWFGANDAFSNIGIASRLDPEAYGAAMARLLAPGVDRGAMGRAARALAEAEFDWGVLVDRLETFIRLWLGHF